MQGNAERNAHGTLDMYSYMPHCIHLIDAITANDEEFVILVALRPGVRSEVHPSGVRLETQSGQMGETAGPDRSHQGGKQAASGRAGGSIRACDLFPYYVGSVADGLQFGAKAFHLHGGA